MGIYINDVKGKAICHPMLEFMAGSIEDAVYCGIIGVESETRDERGRQRVRPCWMWRKGKAGELPDWPVYRLARGQSLEMAYADERKEEPDAKRQRKETPSSSTSGAARERPPPIPIYIRPISKSDHDDYIPIVTDASVMKHVKKGQPWTDSELRSFLKWNEADWMKPRASSRSFYWSIAQTADDKVVGAVGLHTFRSCPDESLKNDFFVTRFLAQSTQGRGVGTEALIAALRELAAMRPDVSSVYSMSKTVNIPAHRSLQKVGFEEESRVLTIREIPYKIFVVKLDKFR